MPVYCLFVRIAIADMSLYALYDVCLQKSKGSQLFGMLKNHSLDDGKSTLRKSKGKNVTFGPTKSMDERYLTKQPKTNGMLQYLPAVPELVWWTICWMLHNWFIFYADM